MILSGKWLIWSNEHRGWWRPGHQGYTENRNEAGRYAFEEACTIVEGANKYLSAGEVPHEAMILDTYEN